MKKFLLTTVAFGITAVFAIAQTDTSVETLLTAEELPAAEKLLPEPPELTSPLFYNDFVQYQNGKQIRDTERGAQAVEDAEKDINLYMKRFSEAMGREMTPETYPAMAEFMAATYLTARLSITNAKLSFHRQRPYSQFNEPSGVPEYEAIEDPFQSYPSGHTIRAWSLALALVGIDPAHQNEILMTGYEMGQSRVIAGYHYQSDVDAARLVAGAAFARIIIEPKWQELFKLAKEEFNAATQVSEVKNTDNTIDETIYYVNGYPSNDSRNSMVISNGKVNFYK